MVSFCIYSLVAKKIAICIVLSVLVSSHGIHAQTTHDIVHIEMRFVFIVSSS